MLAVGKQGDPAKALSNVPHLSELNSSVASTSYCQARPHLTVAASEVRDSRDTFRRAAPCTRASSSGDEACSRGGRVRAARESSFWLFAYASVYVCVCVCVCSMFWCLYVRACVIRAASYLGSASAINTDLPQGPTPRAHHTHLVDEGARFGVPLGHDRVADS